MSIHVLQHHSMVMDVSATSMYATGGCGEPCVTTLSPLACACGRFLRTLRGGTGAGTTAGLESSSAWGKQLAKTHSGSINR